jgi:hypothetical protein
VSLASGEQAQRFDLVFDHWTLSLRRGSVDSLVGKFRGGVDRGMSRIGR